jgi:hypothetical protein
MIAFFDRVKGSLKIKLGSLSDPRGQNVLD